MINEKHASLAIVGVVLAVALVGSLSVGWQDGATGFAAKKVNAARPASQSPEQVRCRSGGGIFSPGGGPLNAPRGCFCDVAGGVQGSSFNEQSGFCECPRGQLVATITRSGFEGSFSSCHPSGNANLVCRTKGERNPACRRAGPV